MLLAEAILEKEYIGKSIQKVNNYIYNLSVVIASLDAEVNKPLIKKKLEELDDLYKKHQQFDITINRIKSQAVLKINDMELTLMESETIKKSMERKLGNLEDVLHRALKGISDDKIVCVGIEFLLTIIDELRLDIKTIDGKIQYVMWNTEIS